LVSSNLFYLFIK